jgi:two-component system chemotaxis response regulator CheB
VVTRDLIVVGASAGGVEALREFVSGLPEDLSAGVLIVLHLPTTAYSALPAILNRAGPLPVEHASEDDPIPRGRILVAPPDRHLLVRGHRIVLGRGPKENGHRPAIDPLFRSAARWFGPRVVGVVLSGTLDDGAAGLAAIHERGGVAVVQDPEDAVYPSMPQAAIRAVPSALSAGTAELGTVMAQLCRQQVPEPTPVVEGDLGLEADMADMDEQAMADPDRPGTPAGLSCPDCHGAMFEIDDGTLIRYRCRVGHAWSPETLLVEQVEEAEAALWMAVRSLEEKGALHRRLADRGQSTMSRDYHHERAREADDSAAIIRDLLRASQVVDLQIAEASPPLRNRLRDSFGR